MKKLYQCLLATMLLAPAALSAATFEGKVTFKMTSQGSKESHEMSYSIKDGRMRIEITGKDATGGVIMDTTKKEMTMIMDAQKMYMVMAIPEAAQNPAQNQKTGDAPTLEKTGETEKILGYTAEKYISTSQNTKTDLWLAEGLGTFMSGNNRGPMGGRRGGPAGDPNTQAWERALAGKELFPLRVIGHDKSGKEISRMEVTAIDKKTLPESLFTPPADYQKFDMGGMMRGMIPGMRPPGGG